MFHFLFSAHRHHRRLRRRRRVETEMFIIPKLNENG